MRAMKDSGIEWIGEIPREWNTPPLKSKYSFGKGLSITKADLSDDGAKVISYGQIHSKDNTGVSVRDSLIRYLTWDNENLSQTAKTNVGDLIFADTSEDLQGCGNCVYIDRDDPIYAGYHTLILRPKSKKLGRYYAYLFVTNAWRAQVRANVFGVKVYSITQDVLKNALLLEPPEEEQDRIVKYLDRKCAEIDALIAVKEKTNALLKERRQSIIYETVTKGLDPSVPMKGSGIKWIGEIPEAWGTPPLKSKYSFGKGLSITKSDLSDDGAKVISYGQIHSKENTGVTVRESLIRYLPWDNENLSQSARTKDGDLIFADTSEDHQGCGNCVYIDRDDPIYAGYHTLILRPKTKKLGRYFAYLFATDAWRAQVRANVFGVKVFSITQNILKNTVLLEPPEDEQERIVMYLDKKCSEIDTLIASNKLSVEKLKEYRQSLIYEAVTGKIEV